MSGFRKTIFFSRKISSIHLVNPQQSWRRVCFRILFHISWFQLFLTKKVVATRDIMVHGGTELHATLHTFDVSAVSPETNFAATQPRTLTVHSACNTLPRSTRTTQDHKWKIRLGNQRQERNGRKELQIRAQVGMERHEGGVQRDVSWAAVPVSSPPPPVSPAARV